MTYEAGEHLGTIACQVCGESAAVRASKAGFAVYTCAGCGTQCFTRNGQASAQLVARCEKGGESDQDERPDQGKPGPEPAAGARRRGGILQRRREHRGGS